MFKTYTFENVNETNVNVPPPAYNACYVYEETCNIWNRTEFSLIASNNRIDRRA